MKTNLKSIEALDKELKGLDYDNGITLLRAELDKITVSLVDILAHRMLITERVAKLKRNFSRPVVQKSREQQIMDNIDMLVRRKNSELGKDVLDATLVKGIMKSIINNAIKEETKIKED